MAKIKKNTLEENKEKYPKLYKEFSDNNDFTPADLTLSSSKKVLWQFDCGHEHERSIRSRLRTKNDTGCQICANRILLKGFNDLSTTHPEVAAQWDTDKNEESPDSIIM